MVNDTCIKTLLGFPQTGDYTVVLLPQKEGGIETGIHNCYKDFSRKMWEQIVYVEESFWPFLPNLDNVWEGWIWMP